MQSMSKTWAGPGGEAAKQFSASGLRTTRTAKTMSMSTTTTTTRGGASKSKRRGSTKVGGGREMEEDPAVAERRRVEMMDRVVVLDAAHAELRRQGKVLESLEHLEKSLFLRRECWGPESTEVDRATQVFISSCNACSMVCLQAGNYKLCAELLRKADVLTGPKGYIKSKWIRRRLKCLTLNNLGCFYRRMGKLHSALRSLEESLKLEIAAVGDVQSAQDEAQQEEHGGGDALDGEPISRDAALRDVATSHLNISAVLSEMARHDASLQHAQCSVEIMRVRGFPERGLEDGGDVAELETFAIANHNMAAEYEHLSMYEEGASAYASAVQAAEQVWGYTHGKTLNMRRAQEECAKLIKVSPSAPTGRLPLIKTAQTAANAPGNRFDAASGAGSSRSSFGHASSDGEAHLRRGSGGGWVAGGEYYVDVAEDDEEDYPHYPHSSLQDEGLIPLSEENSLEHLEGVSTGGDDEEEGKEDDERGEGHKGGPRTPRGDVRRGGFRRPMSDVRADIKAGWRSFAAAAPPQPVLLPPIDPASIGVSMLINTGQRKDMPDLLTIAGRHERRRLVQKIQGIHEKIAHVQKVLEDEETGVSGTLSGGGGADGSMTGVVRVKVVSHEARVMLLAQRGVKLAELTAMVREEMSLAIAMTLRLLGNNGDGAGDRTTPLDDDETLRGAMEGLEPGGVLYIGVHTAVDKEREEAEEAEREAERERLEMVEAEALADKEREEAEEAEREAQRMREVAAEAEAKLGKEEEEAVEAEREAERAKLEAARVRKLVKEGKKAAEDAEKKVKELISSGASEEEIGAAKAAASEAATAAASGGQEMIEKAEAYEKAAAERAQKEREEADSAREEAIREREEAELAEAVAKKEREEYEEAQREAERERREYEEARERAEKERAEYEDAKVLADQVEVHQLESEQWDEENESAKKIGAVYHGFRVRQQQKAHRERMLLSREEDAGDLLVRNAKMRIARGIVKREREQQHSVRVTKASSDIQRCYRGHLGRKIFLVEQETAIEKRIGMASTSIERVYRGHVQRARFKREVIGDLMKGLLMNRYLLSSVTVPGVDLASAYNEGLEGEGGKKGEGKVSRVAGKLAREQRTKDMITLYAAKIASLEEGSAALEGRDVHRPEGHPLYKVMIRFHNQKHLCAREAGVFSLVTTSTNRTRRNFVCQLLDVAYDIDIQGNGSRHLLVLPLPEETLEQFLFERDARLEVKRASRAEVVAEGSGGSTEGGRGSVATAKSNEGEALLDVLLTVARCIEYLHEKRLVVCDIRAKAFGRIGGKFLLTDLSGSHKEGELLDIERKCVLELEAPEVIIASQEDRLALLAAHPSMDIFAFGLLIYEAVASKGRLFPTYKQAVGAATAPGELDIDFGRCRDHVVRYIVSNMLRKVPSDRFTIRDVLVNLSQIRSLK